MEIRRLKARQIRDDRVSIYSYLAFRMLLRYEREQARISGKCFSYAIVSVKGWPMPGGKDREAFEEALCRLVMKRADGTERIFHHRQDGAFVIFSPDKTKDLLVPRLQEIMACLRKILEDGFFFPKISSDVQVRVFEVQREFSYGSELSYSR